MCLVMLSPHEAAPMLGLSPKGVYSLCAARKLTHHRVGVSGGRIVISQQAIDDYLASTAVGGAEVPSVRRHTRTYTPKHFKV